MTIEVYLPDTRMHAELENGHLKLLLKQRILNFEIIVPFVFVDD